jgi:hypothetical protein
MCENLQNPLWTSSEAKRSPSFLDAHSAQLAGQNLPIREAQALVRSPDGKLGMISLAPSGDEWQVAWKPAASGVYGINIQVRGSAPDGAPLERKAFLSVQAQPAAIQVAANQQRIVTIFLLVLAGITTIILILVARRLAK